MRAVVRTPIAVLLAGLCAVLSATTALAATSAPAATTTTASVRHLQQPSFGTGPADSHALTISIDSVSPQYATSATTVTVSGTLSNHTGSALSGLAVQLQTYPSAFATPSDMTSYSGGGAVALQAGTVILRPEGSPDQLRGSLASGASTHWTVSFKPAQDYYSAFGVTPGFGVYPLQVEASSTASSQPATARTLLPYWPGKSAIKPLQVAWIWPLMATPQQGACPQVLATPSLARLVAPGGRLATLLRTGAQWAARDDLTWAIDPALLSDVTLMTKRYFTGGNANCTERTPHVTPSAAATSWLSKLKKDTAGAPAFATPYADVDVSALSHAGLYTNLYSAYQLGNATAGKILPATFGAGRGEAGESALAAAWPAGGTADAGVLASLARYGGIKTAVLSSSEMTTSAPDYDNAPARTTTSSGTSMPVLLADSAITGILNSTSATSTAAAHFAATQDFLAQTAMILAEAPDISRSLVVAPPAGWDPSPAEATDLLQLTRNAPWLRPVTLATLAAKAATATVRKLRTRQVSKAELSPDYTGRVRSVTGNVNLITDLVSRPSGTSLSSSLQAALAVTESAAWRDGDLPGGGLPGGRLALTKLTDYLFNTEGQVKVIASRKVLLAGTSGTTPVSVTNGLNTPVQVLVRAFTPVGSPLRVSPGSFEHPLTVEPHMTQTVRLPMSWSSSSIGTTTMRIQLFTSNGIPLTTSAASASMSVEVTRFGRTLLVIVFGALGVLVLTAIVRLRRKRRAAGSGAGRAGDRAKDKAESRAHAGGAG